MSVDPPVTPASIRRPSAGRWRSWLPLALLSAVALTQVTLVRTSALSPWKGGGFGMFAATDGAAARRTRLVVERDGRSEEVESSPSLEVPELRARLFPSDRRLRAVAEALAAREARRGQPVTSVRVEVWRTTFGAESLAPVEERVRALQHRVR